MLDKGMIHVLGRVEKDGTRFQNATQNSKYFKSYESFISGLFYVMFSDHSWPW